MANSTGPGSPTPTPTHFVLRTADGHQQLDKGLLEPGQHRLGPVGDGDVLGLFGQHPPGEIRDRHAGVGGAQVAGQHDAGIAVEGEHRRSPTPGRRAVTAGDEELVGQQCVYPLGDRRAGEAGQGGQITPGRGVALADEVEDRPRTCRQPGWMASSRRPPSTATVNQSIFGLSKAHKSVDAETSSGNFRLTSDKVGEG